MIPSDPTPARSPQPDWNTLTSNATFVVVFVLSAILTALALSYVYSEKFESYTTISYRTQEVTRFKPQQSEAVGSPAPLVPFKVIAQTLQEVLKSDAVLADVVAKLQLDVNRTTYEGAWYVVLYWKAKDNLREFAHKTWMLLKYGRYIEEDPTQQAIQDLRQNIGVINRDSYIFLIAVRDRYPDRAAQIADHLGLVLADWLLEFDRHPGRSRLDQLQSLIAEKSAAMGKLRKDIEGVLNENKVASAPLETERLVVNLSTLQLEAQRLDSDIARAQQRQASVESKLAIKQQILGSRLPLQLAALAPGAAASAADTSPTGAPEAPIERIQPEDFRKLASQQLFEGVELTSLVAKRRALQQSIDTITARLHRLPAIQTRLDALKLELASVERHYALLSDSYQEASVRATQPVSEVKVLHPAVVPMGPVTPIKVYHVLLAGGLGLLFAIGLVYLLAFLDVNILFSPRRVEDVVANGPALQSGDAPASPSAVNTEVRTHG